MAAITNVRVERGEVADRSATANDEGDVGPRVEGEPVEGVPDGRGGAWAADTDAVFDDGQVGGGEVGEHVGAGIVAAGGCDETDGGDAPRPRQRGVRSSVVVGGCCGGVLDAAEAEQGELYAPLRVDCDVAVDRDGARRGGGSPGVGQLASC